MKLLKMRKTKTKLNVIVLMGGKTPEHKISLISGREVVRNLSKKKYNVLPVVISRDGEKWQLTTPKNLLALPDPLLTKGKDKALVGASEINIQRKDGIKSIDAVFIAMHGPFGEDGTVQGMLETAGLTYTGSGVLASALGMDKIMFRKIMIEEKIPIPRYVVFEKKEKSGKIFKSLGNPPYFVKPFNQGSSVGASIVKTKRDLKDALKAAFKYSDKILVDEYIKGMELTCAVLGNEDAYALPVIEIVPKRSEFFDYESKYAESGSDEIVPARISKPLTKKVQELAVKVHKAIGAREFSRVDFILKEGKYPVVLEINTIPGLTPMSLFPKAAKEAGFSYSQLLDKIVSYSLHD